MSAPVKPRQSSNPIPGDNTPEKAEQARQQRDGDPTDGNVRVKVAGDTPVTFDGTTHEPGATFTAPEAAVENAIARGLVEKVETKAKR